MISLIAVIGKNRELGKDNKLLFTIPDDLKRFRTITAGHPVIMGRKTWESIGRPLPNRTNIVVSSNSSYIAQGAHVVHTFEEGLTIAKKSAGNEEIFVIGGGSLYTQAIAIAERLYLTLVDAQAPADTFFPEYSEFIRILSTETKQTNGYQVTYITRERQQQ